MAGPPQQRAGLPRGAQAPARAAPLPPPPPLPAQAQWQQPAQQWGAPALPPPPLLPEQLAALQQGLAMGACTGVDPYAAGPYAGAHGVPDWVAQYQLAAAMAQPAPQHAVGYVGGGYALEGFPGAQYAGDGLGDVGYGAPMGGQMPPGGGWA